MKPWFAALTIALAASAFPSVQAAADQPPAAKSQADLKPEDCNVFVVLGRHLLDWGKTAPDLTQFAIFYRPQDGGYVEQCPWKALGVTPLPPGQPDLTNMRFFTAPKYSADGTAAAVNFVTRMTGGGHVFMSVTECGLTKTAGQWAVVECRQTMIT